MNAHQARRRPRLSSGVLSRVVAGFAASLLLAGCGSAASPTPPPTPPPASATPAAPAASATPAAPTAAPTPAPLKVVPFKVVIVDPDFSAVIAMAAADGMKAAGQPAEWVEVASVELASDGTSRNEFQFAGGATSSDLLAIQAGANNVVIGNETGNQWGLYSKADITTCAELDKKRVGIFSEGAVATAMVRNWIATNCADIKPEYLVVGGSNVRYAALLAGQIDATALELSDAVLLEKDQGDAFHSLARFNLDLPNLKTGVMVGNREFVEQNPDTAVAFIKAYIDEMRKVNADPAYYRSIVLKYLPETPLDSLDSVIKAYIDLKLLVGTDINMQSLQATIDFFIAAGVLNAGTKAEAIADFSYLERAIALE
jgi:NitT/TauT family transport system substrate-binding protein